MACPGSIAAEAAYRDESSAYAVEGTTAHELAEVCLRRGWSPSDLPEYAGASEGHEWERYDPDMRRFVAEYVDHCAGIGGDMTRVEVRLDLRRWLPGGFGTADYLAVHFADASLDVVDLKYGQGVRVAAEGNPQALLYAAGALAEVDHLLDVQTVRVHIHQPRLHHVDVWQTTAAEVLAFAEGAALAAEAALAPDAPRVPGEKQCRFCRHKVACPELTAMAEEAARTPISPETLAHALTLAPVVSSWVSAVEAAAKQHLADGGTVPGFKLVEGRSQRKWADEELAAAALAEHLDPWTRQLLSVAQAEKALGASIFREVAAGLVTKSPGAPTVAPDSDKRPALAPLLDGFDAVNS